MKKGLILNLLLILLAMSSLKSQNLAINSEFQSANKEHYVNLTLNDSSIVTLRTRFSKNKLDSINYFVDEKYCIIVMYPKNHNYEEYFINAAFKMDGRWIQDYQDRSLGKINTGISCTQINGLEIINSHMLKIEYQLTSIIENFNSNVETEVELGKYGFYECKTGIQSSLTFYNNLYQMGKDQKRSPRTNYIGI